MDLIARLLLAAALAGLVGACRPQPPETAAPAAAATRPVDAVLAPARRLRANDLPGFARDALPPPLHAALERAWRQGRSRWPLEELPLHERLPGLIDALAEDGAEARLRQTFQRQFAGAGGELRRAVETLGLFGVHYVQNDAGLDEIERERYVQLIDALRRWGLDAPLADPERAAQAIDRLCAAARDTGLAGRDWNALGMDDSLRRLSPFLVTLKQVLAGYGLDLDASLDATDATLERQTGDRARLRLRYPLAGQPVDTWIEVERRDRRWYRRDYLRHAEAAVAADARPPAPARAPHPGG